MEAHYVGMILIKEDAFVTNTTSTLALLNIFVRMFLGPFFEYVGIKKMYLVNLALNLLTVFVICFWGTTKIGFAIFFGLNRISNGNFY